MLLKARDHQGVLYMEKRSENSASEFSYLENQGEKREPAKKTEKEYLGRQPGMCEAMGAQGEVLLQRKRNGPLCQMQV